MSWDLLLILLLAIGNAVQFLVHWNSHHRGTIYEDKNDEEGI